MNWLYEVGDAVLKVTGYTGYILLVLGLIYGFFWSISLLA